MKNFYLLFISFLLLANVGFAQRPGGGRYGGGATTSSIKGKITGVMIDSLSKERLPFVTVVVRNPRTEKDITGGITDENGVFKLVNVPVGTYDVLASFVGYAAWSKKVTTTPKKPDADLGKIQLSSTVQELEEVTVEGQKELIVNKIDKIVYNAEQDVANEGGDAADVLRRAPLLNVDLDGNVSLRGSQNIQILINGKPSSIVASSPADALRAIPSDQISSVEVITTPSAKYDGEGTAGIVNIITKKKTPEGFAGNINLSVGNISNRGSASITAGRGRFGFNASGSTYYSIPRDGPSSFFRSDNIGGVERILQEDGINRSSRLGFFTTASAFYDFNAYHALSSSFRLRGFSSTSDVTFDTDFIDPSKEIVQNYERTSDSKRLFSGYEWSLDYAIKFPEQKDRELNFAYKIDGNVQDQEFKIGQEDLIGNDLSLFRDERNMNDGNNTEQTFQVDYVHPVSNSFKLETGGKGILRTVRSDFKYDILNPETNQYEVDPNQTDVFNYDQDVLAGYVSSNIKLGKKIGMVAGARYEYTAIRGDFAIQETPFSNDYQNILPSIIINRKFGKFSSLKASYNRRIQRPNLRFINPYVILDNNRNISQGNPEIEPELTDQYELGFNTFIKKVSVNAAVYYRQTTDVIESFLEVRNDGVSVTTFRNIGEANSIGLNFYTSATLFKVWTLRGGFNLFTYQAKGIIDGKRLTNDAILYNANINSNLKLSKGWIIDVFGFYRAPRQTLQGFNPSFTLMSMGFRKDIWDKKASIGVRIVEPFFEFKRFESELKGDNFYQTSTRDIPFRSFGINFRYKFGKLDFRQRQRRTKINNNDQDNSSGDNNQF